MRFWILFLLLLFWASPYLPTLGRYSLNISSLAAGTPGTFRGRVVEGPKAESNEWIYVLGRNGQARRVDVTRSEVTYDDAVPRSARQSDPRMSLVPGTELRVTAEQDGDGEWRAIRVEILNASTLEKRTE